MPFRLQGLDPAPFLALYGLPDASLAARGVRRVTCDAMPGFPDRVELRDLMPGETALLLNHEHQPAHTPYRSRHAIFVREGAVVPFDAVDTVPEALRIRPISLRAFDVVGEMQGAELVSGGELEGAIARLFADPCAAYLHAHYAVRGCYAARIERVAD